MHSPSSFFASPGMTRDFTPTSNGLHNSRRRGTYVHCMDTWTKTLRSTYTVTRDDRAIAQVIFSGWGRSARASGDGIDWTIARRGLLHQTVTVRTHDGVTLATARGRWSGSYDLTTRDGFTACFKMTGWCGRYAWVASDGTPLITYKLEKWYRQNRAIDIRVPVADEALLLVLGGVLAKFTDDDMTATSVAVVAAAAAGA